MEAWPNRFLGRGLGGNEKRGNDLILRLYIHSPPKKHLTNEKEFSTAKVKWNKNELSELDLESESIETEKSKRGGWLYKGFQYKL